MRIHLRKSVLLAALALGFAPAASANPVLIYLAAILGIQYGTPVAAVTGYGLSHTPSIHIFGNEKRTIGLDWGSFVNRSRNVYGMQMSLCGGGFAENLWGIQFGLTACGWVDGYDVSRCRMNGIEFAPFAVKTATVNGFQICPCYSTAKTVNGFQFGGYASAGKVRGIQCGIVNYADRVDGLQLGIYNAARRGYCLQVGLFNFVERRRMPFCPIVNMGFR